MKALPYFQGTGRRKTSIARVRLVPGEGAVVVNGKPLDDYFARDGAAALTKSGERSAAIGLLRQAIVLDPRDLSTHRRLAAALALAGDPDAAVQEYARFIRDLRDSGEADRAKKEVVYAKGQLRGVTGVSTLDSIADGQPPVAATPDESEEAAEEAPSVLRECRVHQVRAVCPMRM